MSWSKVQAVRDLGAVHIRLLHEVKATQDRRGEVASRRQLFSADKAVQLPAAEAVLVENERRRGGGLPLSAFHAVMAVLVRNGLVSTEQQVETEVDVEIDIENAEASASPNSTAETMYRVTGLGLELLEDLYEAGRE